MKTLFKKTVLFALIAALGLAVLPVFGVAAQGTHDTTPVSNEKLEKAWARQLVAYERMGKTEAFIEKVQSLLDRASANGKDVSAVQSALDAFKVSVKDAKPIYESMKGIVESHQGFDASGKVTDPEKAKATVLAMHEKLQAIKTAMNGTGKALHEAIKAFREANPRLVKTPKP